jgi:tellurite resistance protein TerC
VATLELGIALLIAALPLVLAVTNFHPFLWVGFVVFLLCAMVLDLGLSGGGKAMTTKVALSWCALWVTLALIFNAGLLYYAGATHAEQFFAGYLLEYSLSVDNLFVFVLVFAFFRTPPELQHRALVWGIVGAIVLRASMILIGAELIKQWKGVLALFGIFLVYTAVTLLLHSDDDDPSEKWWVRLLERRLPLVDGYRGTSFIVKEAVPDAEGKSVARWMFTRLFLVVLVIEASDVMFAVDSVPAIFGVSDPPPPPFIVFTANMFAILGLRSLYFALSGAIQQLRYLNYGLSLVLGFIGVKMILAEGVGAVASVCERAGFARPTWLPAHGLHVETSHSLIVIVGLLTVTVVLSVLFKPDPPPEDDLEDSACGLSSSSDEIKAMTADDELGVPGEGEAVAPNEVVLHEEEAPSAE